MSIPVYHSTQNIMFYFYSAILMVSVVGGLCFIAEWIYHKRRFIFMLYWGIGLLLLNWFQIPTILSWAGKQIIYTSFNPLFSISIPLSFLGWIMIYLGIRSVACVPTSKKIFLFLFSWFLASLAFYAFQYRGNLAIRTRVELIVPMVMFLIPIQLLNISALWSAWRKKDLFLAKRSKIGLIVLAVSVLAAISRYAFYIQKTFVYPPEFALVLIRSSDFYVVTQILGVLLVMATFPLIHKEAISGKIQMRPDRSMPERLRR